MRRLARCCSTTLWIAVLATAMAASQARAQGGGENCALATVLLCGDVNQATNTIGHINDYDQASACTGFDSAGPDVVFRIDLASGATVDLTFDGPYDASVYLIRNCADPAGTCVSGSDTFPPGLPDAIFYTNPTAGVETLYLIIDGFSDIDFGPGVLTGTISCAGPPPVIGACCDRTTGGCNTTSNLACAATDGIFQGAGTVCSPTPCPPAESRCVVPGLSVTHDILGDYDPQLGSRQLDVERVQIAEPYASGLRQLVISLKVDSLATAPTGLPLNSLWTVYFSVAGDVWSRRFVQMTSCDPAELPGFAFGHTEPSPTGGDLNVSDVGVVSGTWSGDGTIRITIDPALVGNPLPGTNLTAVHGETTVFAPGAACTGFISTIDDSPQGTYAVKGNDYCTPFTVACPAPFGGSANDGVITKVFTITNPSTGQRRFQATVTDANGWLVGGTLNTSVDLLAGQTGNVEAYFEMPSDCAPSPTDAIQFVAKASDLPAPNNQKTCSTTANCTQSVGVGDEVRSLSFSLSSNPVRGEGMLRYALPDRRAVRIEVFGVNGQRVRTLVNRVDGPGSYSVPFRVHDSGSNLGAGVYLVRITAGSERRSLRVVALD
jgi:hypothetical protein